MPRGLPGGGGWAVLELTGTLLIRTLENMTHLDLPQVDLMNFVDEGLFRKPTTLH